MRRQQKQKKQAQLANEPANNSGASASSSVPTAPLSSCIKTQFYEWKDLTLDKLTKATQRGRIVLALMDENSSMNWISKKHIMDVEKEVRNIEALEKKIIKHAASLQMSAPSVFESKTVVSLKKEAEVMIKRIDTKNEITSAEELMRFKGCMM